MCVVRIAQWTMPTQSDPHSQSKKVSMEPPPYSIKSRPLQICMIGLHGTDNLKGTGIIDPQTYLPLALSSNTSSQQVGHSAYMGRRQHSPMISICRCWERRMWNCVMKMSNWDLNWKLSSKGNHKTKQIMTALKIVWWINVTKQRRQWNDWPDSFKSKTLHSSKQIKRNASTSRLSKSSRKGYRYWWHRTTTWGSCWNISSDKTSCS